MKVSQIVQINWSKNTQQFLPYNWSLADGKRRCFSFGTFQLEILPDRRFVKSSGWCYEKRCLLHRYKNSTCQWQYSTSAVLERWRRSDFWWGRMPFYPGVTNTLQRHGIGSVHRFMYSPMPIRHFGTFPLLEPEHLYLWYPLHLYSLTVYLFSELYNDNHKKINTYIEWHVFYTKTPVSALKTLWLNPMA